MLTEISDLSLGTAAEHLVCAELILKGYTAYLTGQGCAYDIAIDLNGQMVRVQVKATSKLRAVPQRIADTPAYLWHVRRAGKGGKRLYGAKEFDILALVAIDIKTVAYFDVTDKIKQCVILHPPNTVGRCRNFKLKNIDQYPFLEALNGFIARRFTRSS